jgi:DNA-binding response OmpR family regulator
MSEQHAVLRDDRPIRGLVIEDDEALREMLCSVLAALGIEARGVDREQGVDELTAWQAVGLIERRAGGAAASRRSVPRLCLAPGSGLVLFTTGDLSVGGGVRQQAESHAFMPIDLRAFEQLIGKLHRHLVSPTGMPLAANLWTYDAAHWKLVAPNGRMAQLSIAESRVIRCLFERKGDVTGRDTLLTALDRPHLEACSRNLDVTVSRLRKKVESLCQQKLPLTSVRSRGYAFNAPAEIVGWVTETSDSHPDSVRNE